MKRLKGSYTVETLLTLPIIVIAVIVVCQIFSIIGTMSYGSTAQTMVQELLMQKLVVLNKSGLNEKLVLPGKNTAISEAQKDAFYKIMEADVELVKLPDESNSEFKERCKDKLQMYYADFSSSGELNKSVYEKLLADYYTFLLNKLLILSNYDDKLSVNTCNVDIIELNGAPCARINTNMNVKLKFNILTINIVSFDTELFVCL